MSELTIIEEAIKTFEAEHLSCSVADPGKCAKKHRQLIMRAKAYEGQIEARIKSELAGDLLEARDFFVMKSEVEKGELAEWIQIIFNMAIQFLGSDNGTSNR